VNKFDLFDEPYTFKLFQSENKCKVFKKTSLCRDYCKNLLNHCQKKSINYFRKCCQNVRSTSNV